MNFPQWLMESKLIISPPQVSLNRIYFSLSIGRYLEVDLLEMDHCMFRLNQLSIEVIFAQDSK